MLSRMRRADGSPGLHIRFFALLVVLGLAAIAAPGFVSILGWLLHAMV